MVYNLSHIGAARLGGRAHKTFLYKIPFIIFDNKLTITNVAVDAIDFSADTELYELF